MDFCKLVNVFYGSEETSKKINGDISDSWVYLKGMCGNTHPGAAEPFGRMSVCSYSGGYPTGYGTHCPNFSGKIKKYIPEKAMYGFSHMQPYGTGSIGCYCNYCIVTPLYAYDDYCLSEITDEAGFPSYYTATFKSTKIKGEVTVCDGVAHHRYTLNRPGIIKIDFSNDGLSKEFGNRFYEKAVNSSILISDPCTAVSTIETFGLKKYIAVRADNCESIKIRINSAETDDNTVIIPPDAEDFGCCFYVGESVNLKVAISLKSADSAIEMLERDTLDFDSAQAKCFKNWSTHLSKINAEFDSEDEKRFFYTLLYQSMIKPCDFCGESFLYDGQDFFADFATMWDISKTQLPLIFTLFKEKSEKIADTFINCFKALGYFPNRILLSKSVEKQDGQAKMLMLLSLLDAYYRGIDVDLNALKNIDFDICNDSDYPSHILDVLCAYKGLSEAADVKKCSIGLLDAYDKKTGLLKDSVYYEGDKWNYSFRLLPDMNERIALCSPQKFGDYLDVFFGFKPMTESQYLDGNTKINGVPAIKNMFEGFNNEPDMETPYNYLYINQPEKLNSIIKAAMKHLDINDNGAFYGNCDSGGLSACIVWNMLGIFPVSGQNIFLLGCPVCRNAVIYLNNGSTVKIKKIGSSCSVCSVNGKKVFSRQLAVTDLMKGADIVFSD